MLRDEVALLNPKDCSVSPDEIEKSNQSCSEKNYLFFKDDSDLNTSSSSKRDEVSEYLKCKSRDLQSLKEFPSVENVHRKYNTILGSSASIERGFSFGSIIFGKFRHRLADASFEKQLMLKFNKKFWGKLKIQNKCDFCNREFYIILSL